MNLTAFSQRSCLTVWTETSTQRWVTRYLGDNISLWETKWTRVEWKVRCRVRRPMGSSLLGGALRNANDC